jgi:NhaP-type Na+/H+ or K+/H+ antiporter
VFTAAGILLVLTLPVVGELKAYQESFLLLAEVGLVLLLFSDTSRINLRDLKHTSRLIPN